ncbi:late embryogenesis abundant protein-related [Actinidia rufa]|uniref:Late embryogenesis abundant protein-related n=1 Tax=Actinidia rufa TaxID=165716 RepID=A0A7J0ET18_9ERIC|nr:late embryogenesis abundant protein-related [Actinidia rufa]
MDTLGVDWDCHVVPACCGRRMGSLSSKVRVTAVNGIVPLGSILCANVELVVVKENGDGLDPSEVPGQVGVRDKAEVSVFLTVEIESDTIAAYESSDTIYFTSTQTSARAWILHGVTLGVVFVLAPSFLGRGRRRKWWEEATGGDQVDRGGVGVGEVGGLDGVNDGDEREKGIVGGVGIGEIGGVVDGVGVGGEVVVWELDSEPELDSLTK